MTDPEPWPRGAFYAAATLFLLGVVTHGWASDDAFITARTVDNLTHGFGAVSNAGARVQAFTHPLWFLILIPIHFVVKNGYATLLAANLMCAVALVVVLFRGFERRAGTITLLLLAASYSVLSFTTSGLEGSLTYVLLAVVAAYAVRGASFTGLWIAAGLVVLNRFDLALLVAPILVSTLRPFSARRVLHGVVCFLPLLLWFGFSVLYYGSIFPNTAFAKLNLDISKPLVMAQGVSYLLTSAVLDPVLILLLALGIPALFALGGRVRWLGVGALLYVLYVVWVGGDFMAGRLLTPPAVLGAIGIGLWAVDSETLPTLRVSAPVAVGLVSLALAVQSVVWADESPNPTSVCPVPKSGIVDERRCYYGHTALAQNVRTQKYKTHPYFKRGRKWRAEKDGDVVVSTLIGLTGYAAGPGVTVVDQFALSDPLLSRIPFAARRGWRIGHFERPLPAGYLESLRTGTNVIEDPCVRSLYDDVVLVTRHPLFAPERIAAIGRLGMGVHRCTPTE